MMIVMFCGTELPSSYAELNAVFDVYDVTLSGHINYRELVKTVDRQVSVSLLTYLHSGNGYILLLLTHNS